MIVGLKNLVCFAYACFDMYGCRSYPSEWANVVIKGYTCRSYHSEWANVVIKIYRSRSYHSDWANVVTKG